MCLPFSHDPRQSLHFAARLEEAILQIDRSHVSLASVASCLNFDKQDAFIRQRTGVAASEYQHALTRKLEATMRQWKCTFAALRSASACRCSAIEILLV